jgi:hypothetical protein
MPSQPLAPTAAFPTVRRHLAPILIPGSILPCQVLETRRPAAPPARGGREPRVLITWQQPEWRDVNGSWSTAVLRMARLAGDDLDSVRCVFWFA